MGQPSSQRPKFELVEQIGRGQFSDVYKARCLGWQPQPQPQPASPKASTSHQGSGTSGAQPQVEPDDHELLGKLEFVAIKRIRFCEIQNSKARVDCVHEIELLQQLRHPNIINYILSFTQRNELFIVLELANGGDLSKLIRYFQLKSQLIREQTILKYFVQVCAAVNYIHSKRILHRDIKPANIFMTSDGRVKLGDFGLGRFFSSNTRDAHSIVGTFYYMSPERIRETGYNFSSDVWSLGCVLYELVTLQSPFSLYNTPTSSQQPGTPAPDHQKHHHNHQHHHQHHQQPQQPPNLQWLVERILRADYPPLDGHAHVSAQIRQLATECLQLAQDKRPNMDFICKVVDSVYAAQLKSVAS